MGNFGKVFLSFIADSKGWNTFFIVARRAEVLIGFIFVTTGFEYSVNFGGSSVAIISDFFNSLFVFANESDYFFN